MSAQEFATRLASTNDEIKRLTSELKRAKALKVDALSQGKDPTTVESLNKQLQAGQQRLEDLTVTKAALEGKLRVYKQNEPEAAKLRDQVNAAWEELRVIVTGIMKAQDDVAGLIEKMSGPDRIIQENARRHVDLVGESMREPSLRLALSRQVYDFVAYKVTDLGPWQYVSVKDSLERAAKVRAEREAAFTKRKEKMRASAPACKVCGKPMTLREDITPARDRQGNFSWTFEHCFKRESVLEEEAT